MDKAVLQEHLRKEAVHALFGDRKMPAGKAAQELGLSRIAFMALLKQRGIPSVDYAAEDWDAVVSDTSPLVYVAALGDFVLLPALFLKIAIPRAVLREISVGGGGLPEAHAVDAAAGSWALGGRHREQGFCRPVAAVRPARRCS